MKLSDELSFQLLHSALYQAQDGNIAVALGLGFTVEEIREIENLTLPELTMLSRWSSSFIQWELNRENYSRAMFLLREESRKTAVRDQLLVVGASSSLMRHLYGWGKPATANRRKVIGARTERGRTSYPKKNKRSEIHHYWVTNADLPEADRYLKVAMKCEVTAAVVYALVRKWGQEGIPIPELTVEEL